MKLPTIKLAKDTKQLIVITIIAIVILVFMLPGLVVTWHDQQLLGVKFRQTTIDFWRSLLHL